MPPGGVNVDLMIAESMVTELGVVVHDLVLGLNHLWVVLEPQISGNETAVELDDLRDLKFAVGRLVQTASRLNHLASQSKRKKDDRVSCLFHWLNSLQSKIMMLYALP